MLELCIRNRSDIRNDRERTTAQKHFAKLLIDSISWHAMAIWAKGIDEFVHPVLFKKLENVSYQVQVFTWDIDTINFLIVN